MQTTLEIKGETASFYFGSKDISGKYKKSKNGKYYIICDTLYGNSTDVECAVVFTPHEVIYKKNLPGDSAAEQFAVMDDGSAAIITDDGCFILVGPDGKQIAKKKAPNVDQCWETDDILACFGSNDNDESELFIFYKASHDIAKKIIPDIVFNDDEQEDQAADSAEPLFTGRKFVFVYENEKDAVAFDMGGNSVEPSPDEIEQANIARRVRNLKQSIDRAKSQKAYWSKRLISAKTEEEVKHATAEVAHYSEKLKELGVEEQPEPVAAPPVTAIGTTKKKNGFFAKLFRK